MPDNHYDQASRFAARLDAAAFVAWLLNLPAAEFGFRGWLDTRGVPFPGAPDRTSDTVAHLTRADEAGVPWLVAIEFQTKPDPEMFGRLLGYLSELWMERKPDAERGSRFHLGAAVVNLTGNGLASRAMNWPAAGLLTQLAVAERNLASESAADLLAGIESGRWSRVLLPWAPLMTGGDQPDLIDYWKALAEAEPNTRRKSEIGGLALVFAEKASGRDTWQRKLEGWNVEESALVNSWIARGKEIGKEIGSVEAARRTVLRLGAKRFGGATPTVSMAIQSMSDRGRLERIIDRIFDAASWDDLLTTE
ncbi:hypothetical protein R5W23_000652 [Gemmata sp. JC673]|uniref:Rpn family recombination-promoting nuclease/putative transposase n=1 Tax=Gemmata algarum TaxID=2975278 RepID=A0ABU5EWG3_9BACT|nr:hypothetical protein [Gemmata algarum]MDY3559642.1 hypothetical protein [Gemmata algarum]